MKLEKSVEDNGGIEEKGNYGELIVTATDQIMPNIIPGYKTLKGAVKGVKELHTGMLRVDDNINNQVESTGELAGILTCYLIYGSNALAVMAGTGNPYFTTDTAAALRAVEIDADIFIKATMVDGIFSADPKKDNNAVKYDTISYGEVIAQDLKVIDHTAITLCRENNLPIKIFDITQEGNILKAVTVKNFGSIIN